MSFPPSWARIPITATYLLRDEAGTPATGRVEFRSSQIVVADGSIIVPVRVTATLDSAGQISLSLPATDDPDIQPNSWTWSVTEIIDRQPRRTYALAVPHAASSIDLSSIAPIPSGTPVYDYLLTSAIGVTVAGQGDLDALDGRVVALEQGGGGVQSVAGRTGAITLTHTDIGGLGTAATAAATDFATAAQGAKADTALQPADGLAALDSAAATKLGTIATGATVNASDAQLRDRSTHTGTQAHTTITGLGDAATRNVGTTAGTVAAGDDARLSDARTPTAHTHPTAEITGLGTAATANATDFATAAQGTLADGALQSTGGTMTGAITNTPVAGLSFIAKNAQDVNNHSFGLGVGGAEGYMGWGKLVWGDGSLAMRFSPPPYMGVTVDGRISATEGLSVEVAGQGAVTALTWEASGIKSGTTLVGYFSYAEFPGTNHTKIWFGGTATASKLSFAIGNYTQREVASLTEDGSFTTSGPVILAAYTVAALPLAPPEGATAYATNGRKSGEGAGAGTGVPVYYSAGKWRVYRDDSEVQA